MYRYTLETIDVNEKEAEIVGVYKSNNEYVEKGETVCAVETTKVAMDIEAQVSGYIQYLCQKGDKVGYGEVLFAIKENKDEKIEESTREQVNASNNLEEDVVITQKAREYMEQHGIEKSQIEKKGVIKLEDVKSIVEALTLKSRKSEITVHNRKRIVIIGGGPGGEVVSDILLDYPEYEIVGFVDDLPRENFSFYGIKVIYNNIRRFPLEYDRDMFDAVIISFTKNLSLKKEIYDLYTGQGIPFINAIDKSAKIGRNTKIGVGNVIGAQAYIGTSSEIGDGNWIAACVNIDHHNKIGSYNLFGPNFSSPGEVKVGSYNKFGANSSLSNLVTVGDFNIVMNNVGVYRNLGTSEQVK